MLLQTSGKLLQDEKLTLAITGKIDQASLSSNSYIRVSIRELIVAMLLAFFCKPAEKN